jgi:predicted enzyme related to lactoylglutathione lyase
MEIPTASKRRSEYHTQITRRKKMPDYSPGVPMWIDVSSPDLDKSRTFYSGLMGWEASVVPDPQAGGYTMLSLGGKTVGALSPIAPGQHPVWSTYVGTDNAQATAQTAKRAGGEVVMEPTDVMGQGILAVLRDPTGAYISVWQPLEHRGAELVNEVGAWGWNELYTRDMPAAVDFYKKVFGWNTEETDMGDMGKYTLFKVGDRAIAGGMDMTNFLPEDVPPHWLVYFTVKNTDETMNKAKELGGKVLAGPNPTPMGPMAVLEDSVGAPFAVIQINEQS